MTFDRFNELFDKFDQNGDGQLSFGELFQMTEAFRNVFDIFGWIAAKLEWGVYFLLAQQKGRVSKERTKGMYDGSLFYEMAKENQSKK